MKALMALIAWLGAAIFSSVAAQPAAASCSADSPANQLLSAARAAAGVGDRGFRSLYVEGTPRRMNPAADPVRRTLAIEWPDKYTVRNASPLRGTTAVRGFNGRTTLGQTLGLPANTKVFSASPAHTGDWLHRERSRAAHLLMGWFALEMPGATTRVRDRESVLYRDRAAQGVTFRDSVFRLRELWVDNESCLPLGILYERERHQLDDPDPEASSPALVREEAVLLNRRMVGGLRIPHRIQSYVAGRLVEDWSLDVVRVNAVLDAQLFAPPKSSR